MDLQVDDLIGEVEHFCKELRSVTDWPTNIDDLKIVSGRIAIAAELLGLAIHFLDGKPWRYIK